MRGTYPRFQRRLRLGVMTGRSGRIARTTNPPLLRLMPWQPMLSRFCDCGQRLTRRFALAPIGSRFGTEASITLPWRPVTATRQWPRPAKVRVSRHSSSGANGIRTRDLLLAKQALSQLSYGPDSGASLGNQPSKSKSRGGRCSNQRRSWSGASCRNSGVLSRTSSDPSSSSRSYSTVSCSR
jgi:hypothetical protein